MWLLFSIVFAANALPFTTRWVTSIDNTLVSLPIRSRSVGTISWGDGASEPFNTDSPLSHNYSLAGSYTVTINGTVRNFAFMAADCDKLFDVISWGDHGASLSFNGCTHLANITARNRPTFELGMSLASMFRNCPNFNAPLDFDVSNVTSFRLMFSNATSFNSSLNFNQTSSSVSDMGYMFQNATSYDQPILFSAERATNLDYMFFGASSFNNIINFTSTPFLTDTSFMFAHAFAFNQLVALNTSSVISMESMFALADHFDQPLNFDTRRVGSMKRMFYNASRFNSPLNFTSTTQVNTMQEMFSGAHSFDQEVNFDTQNVEDVSRMFFQAESFDKPVVFDTRHVLFMNSMFMYANNFNQEVKFDTTRVITIFQMFYEARSFNQPINFTFGYGLMSVERMFAYADSYNSPIYLKCPSVESFSGMFMQASAFNQTVAFDAPNATSLDNMFASCSSFNAPVSFSSKRIEFVDSMFLGASSFNQPLTGINVTNVQSFDNFLAGALSFDQPIYWPVLVRTGIDMSNVFTYTFNFNSPVIIDTRNVFYMSNMFYGASSFNQPLNFNVTQVRFMDEMFSGAINFIQNLGAWTPAVANVCNDFCMYCGLPNFTSCTPCSSLPLLSSMQGWKVCECAYGQFLPTNSSQCVGYECIGEGVEGLAGECVCSKGYSGQVEYDTTDGNLTGCEPIACLAPVYQGAAGNCSCAGPQYIGSVFYTANNVSGCAGVACLPPAYSGVPGQCECGVGHEGQVNYNGGRASGCVGIPCISPAYQGSPGACVCGVGYNGIVTYANGSTFGCSLINTSEAALCRLAEIGPGLLGECLTVSSSPMYTEQPVDGSIVSPIYNITSLPNSSSTFFVFTLPLTARATLTQNCYGSVVKCEWQDPVTKQFQSSGCFETAQDVALGNSTNVGVECTCDHLTVFALVLRSIRKEEALCQAEDQDYALIGLYVLVGIVLTVQITRLVVFKSREVSLIQHACLLFVTVMRIVYLVAKPIISSSAGLVFLALLASAVLLSVFIHLLLAWASLQMFAMSASPFAKFRIPLLVVILCVFLLSVAITIAVAALGEDNLLQTEAVLGGAYCLAVLYAFVCILVVWSGLGLNRMLKNSASASGSRNLNQVRLRVLTASIGLGFCLLLEASLWAAAVQDDILESVAATVGTSVAFYVFDWLSICVLTGLFASGVQKPSKPAHKKAISLS